MGRNKILALSKHLSGLGDFTLRELELAGVHNVLKKNKWNRTATAQVLDCALRTVRNKASDLRAENISIKDSTPRPRKFTDHLSERLVCTNTDCTKSTLCIYYKHPLDVFCNHENAHDLIEEKCTWYKEKTP